MGFHPAKFGLPRPFPSRVMSRHGTDRWADRRTALNLKCPSPIGQGHNKVSLLPTALHCTLFAVEHIGLQVTTAVWHRCDQLQHTRFASLGHNLQPSVLEVQIQIRPTDSNANNGPFFRPFSGKARPAMLIIAPLLRPCQIGPSIIFPLGQRSLLCMCCEIILITIRFN